MTKRKNRRRNNLLIFGLLGLIVALVAFSIWQQQSKPKGEKVAVETIGLKTITEEVSASGRVFPQTEVKISSDVSGEIVELLVEEGDSVVIGQLLAKIDPDAIQSQVERGQAGVDAAKANLANSKSQIKNLEAQKQQIEAQLIQARAVHKRNEELKAQGVVSQADFETSLSNLQALEANLVASTASIEASEESAKAAQFNVKSSEASLKELRTSLRRTSIYAPMNGIVSKLSVEQGERVVGTIQMTGTEMLRIANLNAMEVRVDVSENDIPRVSNGDQVDIEVDAYIGRTFKGTVYQIANSATNTGTSASLTSDQVTNFEVRIIINPDSYTDLIAAGNTYPFRPGMSASVDIKTETAKDVVSIPIQAVTTREKDEGKKNSKAKKVSQSDEESSLDDLKEVVFICVGDTVSMVEVKTGIQDDSYIHVLDGIKEGDEVVTGPYNTIARKLKQGMQVRKVKEDELYNTKKS